MRHTWSQGGEEPPEKAGVDGSDGGAPASDWSPGPRAGPSLAGCLPLALPGHHWHWPPVNIGFLLGSRERPLLQSPGPGPVVVTHCSVFTPGSGQSHGDQHRQHHRDHGDPGGQPRQPRQPRAQCQQSEANRRSESSVH